MWECAKMDSTVFCLEDYDCIGFDLDCTLAEYNVREIVKLVYDLLVNYLIEKKSYERDLLENPFTQQEYFLQKGLFLDLKKGNVLKLDKNGGIIKATHGTVVLTEDQIIELYGADKRWKLVEESAEDPLSLMNTSLEKAARATLDCFDMAVIALFARIVDRLDKSNGGSLKEYSIWPDILAGLYHLYNTNSYASGESPFFSALRKNSHLYYKKWTPEKVAWLKGLKAKKFVYLLTNSFLDFASLTAEYCIGENWKDYFHVVLCYAKKPSFFTASRPFLSVRMEAEVVLGSDLQIGGVYSQGNWLEFKTFISKHTNVDDPKCLYIGDNIIQDVYSPVHGKCCHSVAVSPELERQFESLWGSYFDSRNSYWNHLIKTYARICVPSLDVFVSRPLDFKYFSLKNGDTNEVTEENGFYIS